LICSERRDNRRVQLFAAEFSREQILTSIAERASAAMGIATIQDIATYYNLKPAGALEGLQQTGAKQVSVEGSAAPGWLLHAGVVPAGELVVPSPTLVGPFDNLIFDATAPAASTTSTTPSRPTNPPPNAPTATTSWPLSPPTGTISAAPTSKEITAQSP
jgi:hypothetical protein